MTETEPWALGALLYLAAHLMVAHKEARFAWPLQPFALWAALIALINQHKGKPVGYINPHLYTSPGMLRDITTGNNGAYKAGTGWDPCTGLGSPNGAKLAAAL